MSVEKKLAFIGLFLVPVLVLAQVGGVKSRSGHNDPTSLAFTHVTIIDVTGGLSKPDMTVVISGDRVTALRQSRDISAPGGAQIVDATGKFLIPGLWDMHAHSAGNPLTPDILFPLEVANGVTGVRDMFADCHPPCVNKGTAEDNTTLDQIKEWRRQIAAGTLLGPRIVASSPLVDGPKPIWPGSIPVANAEEARAAVREIKQSGADFIKVYSLIPRDAYFALADEANKQNFVFAGHVPISVTNAEASDAGQRSIEHLTQILSDTSTDGEQLKRQGLDGTSKADTYSAAWWEQRRQRDQRILSTHSDAKAAALFARFVKNGTWQCPTLTVLRSSALLNDKALRDDPRLQYLPPGIRGSWPSTDDPSYRYLPSEYADVARQIFREQLEIVGAMQRAGVSILAGTDELNPYVYPGFSLHNELELLVEAGLTPMQALQAATTNPARYLGKEKELGAIAAGKLADLVLLDADPLTDIRNTLHINAVVLNGRLLTKDDLQKLLAGVATAAKN